MKGKYFFILTSFLIINIPALVLADGGMHIWPPYVHLDQYAQNAIIGWNGQEEILIISTDVQGSEAATALRIVPLPSNPVEIKEGSLDSFQKLVEIINQKLDALRGAPQLGEGTQGKANVPSGIEITFQQIIGAHDITVVKVNELNDFLIWINDFAKNKGLTEKSLTPELKQGISNYLKKDIRYFVFDVVDVGKDKESIKPIIYRFKTDFLYYPVLISGVSEISSSNPRINLFLIVKKDIDLIGPDFSYYGIDNYGRYDVALTKSELQDISQDLASLFEEEVRVTKLDTFRGLANLKKDLMMFSASLWSNNLTIGNTGSKVKSLQRVLINEGLWEAKVGATGYFGPITRASLVKFQERYNREILQPLNLKAGTGYFGPKSRNYISNISLADVSQ